MCMGSEFHILALDLVIWDMQIHELQYCVEKRRFVVGGVFKISKYKYAGDFLSKNITPGVKQTDISDRVYPCYFFHFR